MKSKGVSREIEEAILKGESREVLNSKYNKGTVTKVFNKLEKDKIKASSSNICDINCEKNIESQLGSLITMMFQLIDKKNEYKINVNISKKGLRDVKEVLNPFKLYNDMKKQEMEAYLTSIDKESLLAIIKKYFKYSSTQMKLMSNEKLAEYICDEVNKVLNIGNCFR